MDPDRRIDRAVLHGVRKLRVDGQVLEHADVAAAGIPARDGAHGRTHSAQDDANSLAPYGRVITVVCGNREHEPVGQDMRAHVRLPKHVCAFEVNGCVVKPAASDESLGEADFFGKGLSEQ